MKRPMGLSRGFEAISHQGTSLLFKEMCLLLDDLLNNLPVTQKALTNSSLATVIKKRTGLNIKFKLEDDINPNAYVIPPDIDKNNPVINYVWVEMGVVNSVDGLKQIKKNKGVLKGTLNTKESTVDGIYSKIETLVGVTSGLFNTGKFTSGEIAAIILHELGHVYNYYEFLEFNLTANATLVAAMNQYYQAEGTLRRHEIIDETCKTLNINIDDPDTLYNVKNKEVLQTILLREATRQNVSSLGSGIYDYTAWEASADQFATRHGAGRDLVTALDKINKIYGGSPAYRSTIIHLILNALGIFLFLAALGVGLVMVLILLFVNPAYKTYDPDKARMTRIRQELVAGIKDKSLSPETRQRLVQDIKAIDAIAGPLDDKRGWIEMFHTSVRPSGRRQQSQLEFQKDLETLINNDLFVAAARFENITI